MEVNRGENPALYRGKIVCSGGGFCGNQNLPANLTERDPPRDGVLSQLVPGRLRVQIRLRNR